MDLQKGEEEMILLARETLHYKIMFMTKWYWVFFQHLEQDVECNKLSKEIC